MESDIRPDPAINDVTRLTSGAPHISMSRSARHDHAGKPDWSKAGIEPTLTEVMNDPIVHLVMRRDSLTPDEVWSVINAARRRLKHTPQDSRLTGASVSR